MLLARSAIRGALLLSAFPLLLSTPALADNEVVELLERAERLRREGDHAAAEHFYREAAELEAATPSARCCDPAAETAGLYLASRGYLADAALLLERASRYHCWLGCGRIFLKLAEIYDDLGEARAMEATWVRWIEAQTGISEDSRIAARVMADREEAAGRARSARFLEQWLLANPDPPHGE